MASPLRHRLDIPTFLPGRYISREIIYARAEIRVIISRDKGVGRGNYELPYSRSQNSPSLAELPRRVVVTPEAICPYYLYCITCNCTAINVLSNYTAPGGIVAISRVSITLSLITIIKRRASKCFSFIAASVWMSRKKTSRTLSTLHITCSFAKKKKKMRCVRFCTGHFSSLPSAFDRRRYLVAHRPRLHLDSRVLAP